MDFGWSPEQARLRDEVDAFARAELDDDVVARDARQEFFAEGWRRCGAFGIQGLAVPEAYGGRGADPLTIAAALEALGYRCRDNGLLFAINAHMWSCALPLTRFGTEEQKRRWLPRLADGSMIGVQAMTEPGSGSDAFALTTRATRRDGGYVLDGRKAFITNAPVADLFVLFATTDPGGGVGGICAFLVERGTPGLTVSEPVRKMGVRTALMGQVELRGCAVPAEQLLGPPGAGLAVFTTSMDWERGFILASTLGTMRRQLERAVEYARERRQFGQSIGRFQAVSHRLVDMRARLEAARLLVFQAAWRRGLGERTTADAALAKLFCSEAFLDSSLDALSVHGGRGFLEETELERDVRDAIGARIYSGTSDVQRNVVARAMGL